MDKKRIILIHGWEGSPRGNWFPWLANELEKLGHQVCAPQMPNANHPKMAEWIEYLKKIIGPADENVFLVGHSLGVIAILRYLESLKDDKIVGGAVLVSGFAENVPVGIGELDNFFETPLDYDKIKGSAKHFIVINSDDDPYVPLENGKILQDNLDAEFTMITEGGHLMARDGFREFPFLLEQIERFI